MAVKTDGQGFGSFPGVLIQSAAPPRDYLLREIRCGASGVSILGIRAQLDTGMFIRAAGDATVNGGEIYCGRVGVILGRSSSVAVQGGSAVPPGPSVAGGQTPAGWVQSDLGSAWKLLWQANVFAYPRQDADRFTDLELFAVGDNLSLYVILGGLKKVIAGTDAAPGSILDADQMIVDLSVTGIDHNTLTGGSSASPFGNVRSLPRYDIQSS